MRLFVQIPPCPHFVHWLIMPLGGATPLRIGSETLRKTSGVGKSGASFKLHHSRLKTQQRPPNYIPGVFVDGDEEQQKTESDPHFEQVCTYGARSNPLTLRCV